MRLHHTFNTSRCSSPPASGLFASRIEVFIPRTGEHSPGIHDRWVSAPYGSILDADIDPLDASLPPQPLAVPVTDPDLSSGAAASMKAVLLSNSSPAVPGRKTQPGRCTPKQVPRGQPTPIEYADSNTRTNTATYCLRMRYPGRVCFAVQTSNRTGGFLAISACTRNRDGAGMAGAHCSLLKLDCATGEPAGNGYA
ncbi:hypothetical protein BDD12DRAFT_392626 [Trichophaea hybrida]|nr:hypothetical protein BDD12DRAFT_392626 [Trichophaea hybrida]